MAPTVYLVTGANRGIGLGLVTLLAARDNVHVYAGARNPDSASDLKALETKYPGKVHTLKLVAGDQAGSDAAIAEIKRISGRLDVVIANAGIAKFFGSILNTPQEELLEHYQVNLIGTTVLFQAVWPLLKESPEPKFAVISTVAGSITVGAAMPAGFLAYGASKAALNYLAMKLHSEHPELVVLDLSPGPVQTDMGEFASSSDPVVAQMEFISVETSATAMMKIVDAGKREPDGPKLVNFDGTVYPW